MADSPADDGVRVTLRLPTDIHRRVVDEAASDMRSLNSEIAYLLKWALDQRQAKRQE